MARATASFEQDAAPRNGEWDAFVEQSPGGHHAQSSIWAEVKATLGWDAVRLIARQDGAIVAGVQLLTRRIKHAGVRVGVAFAPRGPIVSPERPELLSALTGAVLEFADRSRLGYVKLQPPEGRDDVVEALKREGWVPSTIKAAPVASLRVRVDREDDEILRSMSKSTRRSIRQSAKRGAEIQVGAEEDLPMFRQVLESTAQRQGFNPYPASHYEAMWRLFGERGKARLSLAKVDGNVVAANLAIAFGDTVTAKIGGWNGVGGEARPMAAIDWDCIGWARAGGYRYYDFDGLAPPVAHALLAGEELPQAVRSSVIQYKLGFGGEPVLFPQAVDNSPRGWMKLAIRVVAPRLSDVRGFASRAAGRVG